jgi:hypothetical protein
MATGCTKLATKGVQLFFKHPATEKTAEVFINIYACADHQINEEINKLLEANWPRLTKGFNLHGLTDEVMMFRWQWVPIDAIEEAMKTRLAETNEENPYRM